MQGTKVLTDDGLKNIEDIKVNDLVFAKEVENNKKDYKIVKELYQNKVDTILKLNIDLNCDIMEVKSCVKLMICIYLI